MAASSVRDAIVKWHVSIYREGQSKSDSQHHTSFKVAESGIAKSERQEGRTRPSTSDFFLPTKMVPFSTRYEYSVEMVISKVYLVEEQSEATSAHPAKVKRRGRDERRAEGTHRPTAIFMIPLLSSHSIFCQYTHPVLPKATPQARKPRRSLTSVWVKSCT